MLIKYLILKIYKFSNNHALIFYLIGPIDKRHYTTAGVKTHSLLLFKNIIFLV
jgi:hypothetical protein